MNTRSLIAAAVALAFALCHQAHAQEDGEPEVTQLEGTWVAIHSRFNNQTFTEEQLRGYQWRIEGSVLYDRGGGSGDWNRRCAISLNPMATPAEFDFAAPSNLLAIYELEGDTLRVCWVLSDRDRPTAFEWPESATGFLYTFRRVEEDDE